MQNLYETVVIVTPDANEDGVNAVIGDLRKVVENNGGTVLHTDLWGRRRLAYRVKKKDEGIYVLFHTEGPTDLPQRLKARMRIDESVIRYMVVRLEDEQAEKVRAEAEEHASEESKAAQLQKVAAERRAAAAAETAAMSAAEAAAAGEAAAEAAEEAAAEPPAEAAEEAREQAAEAAPAAAEEAVGPEAEAAEEAGEAEETGEPPLEGPDEEREA